MFIIRPATAEDLPTLLKLARMVHFINLPNDRDALAAKIVRSRRSFAGECDDVREREYMFVLEDLDSGNVIGTSAIISCISWPGHPHTYLSLKRRSMFSEDLQTGQVHLTLEFGTDESGPSELGGLILAPGYRGHAEKLGSFLSLVRLHFLALHREAFSDRILAELMGALTPDSRNLLWEYLGRRFINLSYTEADLFCQHSKEFITSLFPRGEIYASLLPAEARNLIGRVGEETRPARRMLERQGFEFKDHVDPFDGGPYIEARLDRIPIVAATRRGRCGLADDAALADAPWCMASCEGELGFRAVRTRVADHADPDGLAHISPAAAKALGATEGDQIGWTPVSAKLDVPPIQEVPAS
ncbi:MAG: arginine N-succinyltransferase [Phycisphaerales bacterium]